MLVALARAAVIAVVGMGGLLGASVAATAQTADVRAVAYINPDTGKDTENPGVAAGSSCESPDQSDTMALGDEGTGSGNVHVDACLFSGGDRVDAMAAFEVSGVGVVSGCPDADKEGPKTATKSDTRCLQGGFEQDNEEYHVRVVSSTAGVQTVRFCADPEGNGCGDATDVSTVQITWGAPQGGVAAGGSSPVNLGGSPGLALAALLGAVVAGGVGLVAARR